MPRLQNLPLKMDAAERALADQLAAAAGVSRSELIRRCFWLAAPIVQLAINRHRERPSPDPFAGTAGAAPNFAETLREVQGTMLDRYAMVEAWIERDESRLQSAVHELRKARAAAARATDAAE